MYAVYNAVTDSCVLIYDVDDQQYLFISPCIYAIAGLHPHELAADNNLWYKLINNKQADSIYELNNNIALNGSNELSYQITTPQNAVKTLLITGALLLMPNRAIKFCSASSGKTQIKNRSLPMILILAPCFITI